MLYINTTLTVGTDPVVAAINRTALNSTRRSIIILNESTGGQKVSLAVGETAVSGSGIVLYIGGSFDRSPNEEPPQVEITAISDIAGAIISIYEEVENGL
jgi:hypothetical protein